MFIYVSVIFLSLYSYIHTYTYIYICKILYTLFYIHHWQRNHFYSIQISFGAFFKKSFVDREIQIEEIEITECNIIWLYYHYADCSRTHNNALFVPCCNWHLCIPFSESPLEMQLCQNMMMYYSTWNWTSAFGKSPMRQTQTLWAKYLTKEKENIKVHFTIVESQYLLLTLGSV